MADQDSVTRLNAALEGRYRIQREFGEGGMATVYLALGRGSTQSFLLVVDHHHRGGGDPSVPSQDTNGGGPTGPPPFSISPRQRIN